MPLKIHYILKYVRTAISIYKFVYSLRFPFAYLVFNVPSLSDITHLTFVEFELNLLKILNRPSGVIQIHEIRGIMFGESTPTIKISSESDTIVEKPNERRKLIRKKILIAKRRLNKDNAFINERVETISKFVNNKLNLYEDDLSQFIKNDKLSSRKEYGIYLLTLLIIIPINLIQIIITVTKMINIS